MNTRLDKRHQAHDSSATARYEARHADFCGLQPAKLCWEKFSDRDECDYKHGIRIRPPQVTVRCLRLRSN